MRGGRKNIKKGELLSVGAFPGMAGARKIGTIYPVFSGNHPNPLLLQLFYQFFSPFRQVPAARTNSGCQAGAGADPLHPYHGPASPDHPFPQCNRLIHFL